MKQSFLRRGWSWWRSPSAKWALGTLLVERRPLTREVQDR